MTTIALARLLLFARRHQLKLNTLQALAVLQSNGPTTCHDLAAELDVSSAAVTCIGDRLVALNLATRTYGKADRRMIYLTLTHHGQVTLKAILHPEPSAPAHKPTRPLAPSNLVPV